MSTAFLKGQRYPHAYFDGAILKELYLVPERAALMETLTRFEPIGMEPPYAQPQKDEQCCRTAQNLPGYDHRKAMYMECHWHRLTR